jgi:SAM-dependent methyltransferase
VAERIVDARTVLDFGCGPGILTTFYARRFPDRTFVGVDRSASSVAAARDRASALRLGNVRFECLDVEQNPVAGSYDLIVATHSLVQAELDPGLPSLNWRAFERARDGALQSEFERRTGLAARLDALCSALASGGRLIAFEKTRPLARRVPFQRALSARGFRLLEPPRPIRYLLVEEVAEDGPSYVLGWPPGGPGAGAPGAGPDWDEGPERVEDEAVFHARGAAAQEVWARLPDRAITRQVQWTDPELGPVQAEWGRSGPALAYLYLTIGEKSRGILVGSESTGAELGAAVALAIETCRQGSGRLAACLEETWPSPIAEDDASHTPLYENHTAAAQTVWESLPGRCILQESTVEEPGSRQSHLELGETPGLVYLYWADTFDHRQLVVMDRARARLLEEYYGELLEGSRAMRDTHGG